MALQTFSHIFQKQTTDRLVDVDHNDNFFFFKSLDFNWSQEHNKSNGITIWMLKSFLQNLFCVLSIYRSFFPWKFVAINSICMVSSSNLMCVCVIDNAQTFYLNQRKNKTYCFTNWCFQFSFVHWKFIERKILRNKVLCQ